MWYNDSEPVGTVFFGGIKINNMEGTSSFSVGDNFFQSLDSQTKTNLAVGQINGDFNYNNSQPIGSPVYDPDGLDTTKPMVRSPLGLED